MNALHPHIAREIKRRNAPLDDLFPQQREAVLDPTRKKAYRTPRRAGKTWALLANMFADGANNPRCYYRYVALTRGSAKDIAWPVAREINYKYNIGAKFNNSELYITLPNESQIHLYGADKTGWMDRMRGTKNRLVVVDEAASFTTDLFKLIAEVLEPTLLDLDGQFVLAGTPGGIKGGIFYHVTAETGKYRGWKAFRWSTRDNPSMTRQYEAMLESIKEDYPDQDITELPWVQREWFGDWVEDTKDNVYAFDPERNSVYEWKPTPGDQYVCGVDLGWKDRTALVVGVYSESGPDYTVVESFRQRQMYLEAAIEMLHDYERRYPGITFVCDPARRQLMEELAHRADVFIQPAEKHEKDDWIELVNRDLLTGRYKILAPENSPLAEEMAELKWITRPSGKKEENPGQANDCCDAGLYAFRYSYHHRFEEPEEAPEPGSREYYAEEARRMRLHAIRRQRESIDSDSRWWEKR